MANEKIGCSAGRTLLVDPNFFGGQNSSDNISIPLEDLNISVQLETSKKARTILTSTEVNNTIDSSTNIKLKFIEGTVINGEKVLTTKYTDLTTSFDQDGDGETLGITNIDIDFSSAMAPLITINFIDIKGSSIFQNESKIKNGINKFSTFFQLPYPIYALTIKGYYGMPVRYCLHMTKWDSKFNSQTGNFEITANFVGYTYAMLSDMLIGYLKAIPCTTLGHKKYEALKAIDPSTRTLNELMLAISNIDVLTQKISRSDDNAKQLALAELKKNQLDNIYSIIKTLGESLNGPTQTEYRFILVNNPSGPATIKIFNPNDTDIIINNYNNSVSLAIDEYNDNNSFTIDKNSFIITPKNSYIGLSSELVFSSPDISINPNILAQSNYSKIYTILKQNNIKDFLRLKNNLINFLSKNYPNSLSSFNIYDLNKQYDILANTNKKIIDEYTSLQKDVAKRLRAEIEKELGFDSTIRNIVKVFTTAVEVFMSVLYDVSSTAINSQTRTNELKNFSNQFDIKTNQIFYPWPEYFNDSDAYGPTETYLGNFGILNNPNNVTELEFIDDLLNAFISCSGYNDETQLQEVKDVKNWFPINPIDTRIFGINSFPYSRINGISTNDVMSLVMIRAITYLGLTNRGLTPSEIQEMAIAEANSLLLFIKDEKIKQALSAPNITLNSFINVQGTINGSQRPIVKTLGDKYYYNYIFNPNDLTSLGTVNSISTFPGNVITSTDDSTNFHLIPINNKILNSNWSTSLIDLINNRDSNGDLFLTNYSTTKLLNFKGDLMYKLDDGGVYIKIISPEQYNSDNTKLSLIDSQPINNNILNLNNLFINYDLVPEDGSTLGFNQFGGAYGIQEFMVLNYGISGLEKAPFRFMFYNDGNNIKPNGLGLTRVASSGSKTTPFDIGISSPDYYRIFNRSDAPIYGIDGYINLIDGDNPIHDNYGKNRELSVINDSNISYPYINFHVKTNKSSTNDLTPISLFGSRFYNEQNNDYSKALLFLHTLPWTGLIDDFNTGIFDSNAIINTFANRGGFISVPKLWAAFIGGMLWRADGTNPILEDNTGYQIDGGSGKDDPILFRNSSEYFIPTLSYGVLSVNDSVLPTRLQYLKAVDAGEKTCPMVFSNDLESGNNYKEIDTILLTLPDQAKNEFKTAFFNFVVNGSEVTSDWEQIKSNFQILDESFDWVTTYNNTINTITSVEIGDFPGTTSLETRLVLPISTTSQTYDNFNNYIIFSPIVTDSGPDSDFIYNYFLEIKDSTQASNLLKELFLEETIITNTSYKIWKTNLSSEDRNLRDGITCKQNDLNLYINTILSIIQPKNSSGPNTEKKQTEQEIFGTTDENIIKFQLYRTCKNIYDKWIGGSDNKNTDIIFQGPCGRNILDSNLAAKYTNGQSPSLIDSFRFVDRAFRDIGDLMLINPVPVNDFLRNNPNSSFYDGVSSLLAANNFDFIPLPSYINYNDDEALRSMFKPMSMSDAFKNGISGPSFVCVYVGQKSKNLDFNGSEYKNDGFDIVCDDNGNLSSTVPKDFTTDIAPYENNVAVFSVNYGQQNQNIFKDVNLNQSEFSETAESLQIIDDIAKKGSENNRTIAGQNMYNVYSVRSYKADVEMMGNAMIQPMMYFQLNNIPMFHGAYMITHVKHSLKPNYMSTHFSGVRIKKNITRLLEENEVFMSLLSTIKSTSVGSGNVLGSNGSGNTITLNNTSGVPPIVNVIKNNSGVNGNFVSNNITSTPLVTLPKGISNQISDTKLLLSEAVPPLNAMLTDWVSWMKSNGFIGTNNGNVFAYITSAYRTYEQQETTKNNAIKRGCSKCAATPGTSNHGWGIAIDFQFFKKNGEIIRNYNDDGYPNVSEGYNFNINESLVWLLNNSFTYGWIIPEQLRDNIGSDEFWHFEYHGKSANCLLSKNNKIKGLTIDTNKAYNSLVHNPKGIDGNEVDFGDNCNFINTLKYDGTNLVIVPTNKNIKITPPTPEDIDFYSQVLLGVGAQPTTENLKFMYAWAQGEKSNAAWNPLNTTAKVGSYTNNNKNNGNPVKNYGSKSDGIKATIISLKSSGGAETSYPKILSGLRNNIGAEKLSSIIDELTIWGTGINVNNVLAGNNLVPPPILKLTTKIV